MAYLQFFNPGQHFCEIIKKILGQQKFFFIPIPHKYFMGHLRLCCKRGTYFYFDSKLLKKINPKKYITIFQILYRSVCSPSATDKCFMAEKKAPKKEGNIQLHHHPFSTNNISLLMHLALESKAEIQPVSSEDRVNFLSEENFPPKVNLIKKKLSQYTK